MKGMIGVRKSLHPINAVKVSFYNLQGYPIFSQFLLIAFWQAIYRNELTKRQDCSTVTCVSLHLYVIISGSHIVSIYGFSSCELVSRHVMYICRRKTMTATYKNSVYNVLYFMMCVELSEGGEFVNLTYCIQIYMHLHCGRP